MSHIYHCRRTHTVGVARGDESGDIPHRIHVVARLFEFPHKVGGLAHLSGEHYARGGRLIQIVIFQKFVVFGNGGELQILVVGIFGVGVVKQQARSLGHGVYLAFGNHLAVDVGTHVVEQAGVVAASAGAKVLRKGVLGKGVDRNNHIFGTCGGGGQHRNGN